MNLIRLWSVLPHSKIQRKTIIKYEFITIPSPFKIQPTIKLKKKE